ncbi:MAG: hypothetical protein LBR31_00485 [Desulfovibrio sp.]|nr:hypothetical protein [Desulfovibrio sp.]
MADKYTNDKVKYFAVLNLAARLCALYVLCVLSACALPPGQPPAPSTTVKLAPPAGPCVVLGLPASGSYEAIAAKIRKGAEAARQEMIEQGASVRLEIINTEGAHWLAELSALPAECAVVGSPLQAVRYEEARRTGLTEQRVFFTFLPSLEAGDEGVRAWRFFPSPQDQIDAIVAFATDSLNIRAYGAFYPNDAFGVRMTALLEQSLAAKSMFLQKASYPPGDVTVWSDAAASLVRPVPGPDGRTPIPQTPFEALFLPDSWKNMDLLITSLLYNGEDRLVLLGTTLWEQGLSGRILANVEKYSLAVFPGAWNAAAAPAVLKARNGDFWMALGYDFTRFAVKLGLYSRPAPRDVNAALREARTTWSMAPIFWDDAGLAHQRLWMFQVSSLGMTPADPELFAQIRAAVLQRAALRMQGQPAVDAQGNPLVPLPPGQSFQGNQPALPISSTPRPSYKLSLPQSR